MKGYKAFQKGLICRGYKFEEGKVFEEEEAKICESGFHFCTNPLDTLDYYPLIDDNGDLTEFATVEALDATRTDDNKKYCTRKIKIGTKLDLNGFIEAGFNFIKESCKAESTGAKKIVRKKDGVKVATSGYSSQVATSGDYSKVATSGDYSKVALNGGNSVGANIGISGMIKGKKGCWITLAEYDQDYSPICAKSAQIDGEKIKEDTYYTLKNGEFVEVE